MTMDLKKLFKMQKVLDERIVRERNLNEDDLLLKKLDAFRVELHELENETKHFKYWSSKQPVRTRVLEEYVDGLHFILSIGLELNNQKPILGYIIHNTLAEQFRTINNLTSRLYEAISRGFNNDVNDLYLLLFNYYFGLGQKLGFEWYEVEQAYVDKNSVNHQRQESGVY